MTKQPHLSLFLLAFAWCATFNATAQEYRKIMASDIPENKTLRTEDAVYEPFIRTVQLQAIDREYAELINEQATAILPLSTQSRIGLRLSFDNVLPDPAYYDVKIIHCNANWEPSSIASINYMEDYNEFSIADYEISINTRVSYTHYWFDIPPVKISGNYLVKVYHEDDEANVVLTRRFVIYESVAGIAFQQARMIGGEEAQQRQQLTLSIQYGGLDLPRPKEQVQVCIRQNGRWQTALTDLTPTFINQLKKTLDYNLANMELSFSGGNEFRSFDLSDLENGGFQVGRIVQSDSLNQVMLLTDIARTGRAYDGMVRDQQGGYQIAVRRWNDPRVEADYAEVLFHLEMAQPLPYPVYVIGKFCDWELREECRMRYSDGDKSYYSVQFLKQGIYDYLYWVDSPEPYKIEGSHTNTRNTYDVLVYYRPLGARGDRVIGYAAINN